MKLGDVLKKERKRKSLTPEEVATYLAIDPEQYRAIEEGGSPAEEWAPKLAQIAIYLDTPMSRMISRNGRSDQAAREQGQCGLLIRARREAKATSQQELAGLATIPLHELEIIENGGSPIELYGPLLLKFAEMVGQPIFNLFYPYGVPYKELDEY